MAQEYLESTRRMLASSFPEGIFKEDYIPLICLLYEEMSDRNLALVVSEISEEDYPVVLNDVALAGSLVVNVKISEEMNKRIATLKRLLEVHGYQDWLNEQ